MSLKLDNNSKSLKGVLPGGGLASLDLKGLAGLLSSGGLNLSNVSISGFTLFSGSLDDSRIGGQMPSTAHFTEVEIGYPDGQSPGKFIIYGAEPEKLTYDNDGNIIAREPGDQMSWNPEESILEILGGLYVRDPARFGNLVLDKNTLKAVNTDGNVEILPNTSNASILLSGNIVQSLPGIVSLEKATKFNVDSDTTAQINARESSIVTSDRGDVSLISDYRANNEITNIQRLTTTTRTDRMTFTGPSGATKEQITTYTQTLLGDTLTLVELSTVDAFPVLERKTIKTKTTVDGKAATITKIDTTTIIPKTEVAEEVRQTATFEETTLDKDVANDFTILPNGNSTYTAIITTATGHGFFPNDEVTLRGTNSEPNFNGLVNIQSVLSDTVFTLPAETAFVEGNTGFTKVEKRGAVNIWGGTEVNFQIDVPVYFGEKTIANRPFIEAFTKDDLTLFAKYIRSLDPIPTLLNPSQNFSDSGISVEYNDNGILKRGFFGFVDSTKNFTWVPEAIISRKDDGTKVVTGARGVMELQGIQLRDIIGDPDLNISTPLGGIKFGTRDPISFDSALQIGEGVITPVGNSLQVSAPGNLNLQPGAAVTITENKPLQFSSTTSITGTPGGGLNVTSTAAPVTFNGDISLPTGNTMYIGDGKENAISGDASNITIAPKNSLIIPDDVYLQIGDVPNTGFIAHDGSLKTTVVADYAITSGGSTRITPGSGQLFIDSAQTIIPDKSEIAFGNSTSISSTGTSFLIDSDLPIDFRTTAIKIPANVPLSFGDLSGIRFDPVTGKLHITNTGGIVFDKDITVNGSFTVLGPTSEVISNRTVIQDPIITLGKSDGIDYIKDRGVEFHYGDGKVGFMGYSQQDSRFYLIQEGQNINEVFTKDKLGDLQVSKLYAEIMTSSGGFASSMLKGDPHLIIDATHINFAASQYVMVPTNIPMRYGLDSSITGVENGLKITSPLVNVTNGNLALGNTTIQSVGDNLTITGTLNTYLESKLYIPQILTIGESSIQQDAYKNLVIDSGNQIVFNDTTIWKKGFTLGDAAASWDSGTGTLVFENSKGGILPFSIKGEIRDARWTGQVIESQYGGTGRTTGWHARSVVYIADDNVSMTEDTPHFNYNDDTKCLGIRTDVQENALTIGSGNLDFLHNDSYIIYRHDSVASYTLGKYGSLFALSTATATGYALPASSTVTNNGTLDMMVNKFGQTGIYQKVSYFKTLSGSETAKLYVAGDISLNGDTRNIQFNGTNAYLGYVEGQDFALFTDTKLTVQSASVLDVKSGDRLNISSASQANITSASSLSIRSDDILHMYSAASFTMESANNLAIESGENLDIRCLQSATLSSGSSLQVSSDSLLSLNSADNLEISSDRNVSIASKETLVISSKQTLSLESAQLLSIKSLSSLEMSSKDVFTLSSDSILTLKSLLDLNMISENRFFIASKATMTVTSDEQLTLSSRDNLTVSSPALVNITSGDKINLTSAASMAVSSGDTLDVSAISAIRLSGGDLLSLTSSANLDLASIANISVKAKESLELSSLLALTVKSGNSLSLTSASTLSILSESSFIIRSASSLAVSSGGTFTLASVDSTIISSDNLLTLSSADRMVLQSDSSLAISSGDVLNISSASLSLLSTQLLEIKSLSALNLLSESQLLVKSEETLSLESTQLLSVKSSDRLVLDAVSSISLNSGSAISVTSADSLTMHSVSQMVLSSGANISLTSADTFGITSGSQLSLTSNNAISINSAASLDIRSGSDFSIFSASSLKLSSDNLLSLESSARIDIESASVIKLASASSLILTSGAQISMSSNNTFSISSGDKLELSSAKSLIISSAESFTLSSLASLAISSGDELLMNSTRRMVLASGDLLDLNSANAILIASESSTTISSKDVLALSSISRLTMTSGDSLAISSANTLQISSVASLEAISQESLLLQSGKGITTYSSTFTKLTATTDMDLRANKMSVISASSYILDAQTVATTATTSVTDISNTALLTVANGYTVNSGSYTLVSTSDVHFTAQTGKLFYHSDAVFSKTLHFFEENSKIWGEAGGILHSTSDYMIKLDSPHVYIPQRLCLLHSASDRCRCYLEMRESATTPGNVDAVFANDKGDIIFSPMNAIKLPNVTRIEFGASGSIFSTGTDMNLVTNTGNINLTPGSGVVALPMNTALSFSNGTTTMKQDGTAAFVMTSVTPISVAVPSVKLPDNTPLIFGDYSRRIVSDGDSLFVYSSDLLSLESNNVRISGNLIVSKRSTFTIESETSFDSGVITLGGGQKEDITSMAAHTGTDATSGEALQQTRITVGTPHDLRVGDKVSVGDTIPNVDGGYTVVAVPSPTEIVVNKPFPGLPQGADFTGYVRSAYTADPGYDVGVQANWHTGGTASVEGARMAFFGFDRSTKRFTYIPEATRTNNVYSGAVGDAEFSTLYAQAISASKLVSSMDAGANLVSGSNFFITGGNIDSTPIGQTTPSAGTFTNLHVTENFSVGNGSVVKNLNADFLDGYDSMDFIHRDGSTALRADWNAGGYRITTTGITDTTLAQNGIVLAGENGKLVTSESISFLNGILTVPFMSGFTLSGDIDLAGFSIKNGTFVDGTIRQTEFTSGTITATAFSTGTIDSSTMTGNTFTTGIVTSSDMDSSRITATTFSTGTLLDSTGTRLDITESDITTTKVSLTDIFDSTIHDNTMTGNMFTGGQIEKTSLLDTTMSQSVIAASKINDSTIHTSIITGSSYLDGTITRTAFSDGSISATQFATGSIASSTIVTTSFSDGTIGTSILNDNDFRSGRITNSIINSTNIQTSVFTDGSIVSSTVENSAISNSTAITLAITNSTYKNGTLSQNLMTGNVYEHGTINTTNIDSSSYTNGTIAATAISDSTVASTNISTSVFANGTIQTTNIVDSSITSSAIKDSTAENILITNSDARDVRFTEGNITSSTVADSIITSSRFSNGDVDNSRITQSSFETGTVNQSAITASSFANGSIADSTAARIAISDSTYVSGDITTTAITSSEITASNLSTVVVRESSVFDSLFAQGTITDTDFTVGRIADSDISSSRFVDGELHTSLFDNGSIQNSKITDSELRNDVMHSSTILDSTFQTGQIVQSRFEDGSLHNSTGTALSISASTMETSVITKSTIDTSDITVPQGNTLDVSAGELILRDEQISGEKIRGGVADVDISGNSETVTNGLYRRDFQEDHTIIKADKAGEPISMHVREETLIGRLKDGNIKDLTVAEGQELLDIVARFLFKDNTILKADTAHNPVALTIDEDTVVARMKGGQITDVNSRDWLHAYGAMLKDGHKSYPDGAAMTGNLYVSSERFNMTTGETRILDINVETSYISVNYKKTGGREAWVTLPRGLADGHRKTIIVSRIAEKAVIHLTGSFVIPGEPEKWFVIHLSGQSVVLQWDAVMGKWIIHGTGALPIGTLDVSEHNWIDKMEMESSID